MEAKGHKIVIYFYDNHGCVVDTKATDKGYKVVNNNKAHFSKKEDLLKAIEQVYEWNPQKNTPK